MFCFVFGFVFILFFYILKFIPDLLIYLDFLMSNNKHNQNVYIQKYLRSFRFINLYQIKPWIKEKYKNNFGIFFNQQSLIAIKWLLWTAKCFSDSISWHETFRAELSDVLQSVTCQCDHVLFKFSYCKWTMF